MKKISALFIASVLLLSGCGASRSISQISSGSPGNAASSSSAASSSYGTNGRVAEASETVAATEVTEEWMTPIYGENVMDGAYDISVDSSSSMFRIASCTLLAEGGDMTAAITIASDSYLYLYPGSAENAVMARKAALISYTENEDGSCTFLFPVEALDQGTPCAAMSRKKEAWYDRTLVFRSDSLPKDAIRGIGCDPEELGLPDGEYQADIDLYGGSGRASLRSPAPVRLEEDGCFVTLIFESPNYDYVIADGEKYEPLTKKNAGDLDAQTAAALSEDTSVFVVPLPWFDRAFLISADTTAMSEPHEIEYHIYLAADSMTRYTAPAEDSSKEESPAASSESPEESSEESAVSAPSELPEDLPELLSGQTPKGQLAADYAECFSLWYFEDDLDLLVIGGDRCLLVPEDMDVDETDASGCVVIKKPLRNAYLASSAAMDYFLTLGAGNAVRATSTKAGDWTLPEAEELLKKSKSMFYAGKYSAPDYELLLSEGVDCAIENTMILHAPKVQEQLTELGVPVLIERSSYEDHPLGRLEWIRLYGRLTGCEKEADDFFADAKASYEELAASSKKTKSKSFAVFSINAAGQFTVRRSGDYLVTLLETAGGSYVFPDLEGVSGEHTTLTLQAEEFYAAAKDADLLIYNGTISGEAQSLADLLEKNSILEKFSAFQSGSVYALGTGIFQHPTAAAEMLSDFSLVFRKGETRDGGWLRKLS